MNDQSPSGAEALTAAAIMAEFAEPDDALAAPELDLSNLQRIEKIVTCTIEGLVEQEDLAKLLEARATGSSLVTPAGLDVKRIREKHHAVARLLASGMTQTLVASICGYTDAYLSTLLNNPAMEELIGFYRASHTNAAEAIGHRLRSIAMDAVEALGARLEDEELDDNALLALAKLGLDRSGHGPSSTQHRVVEQHLVDHAELQRLNRAARRESAEDIIQLPSPSAIPAEVQDAVFEALETYVPPEEPQP